MVKRHWLCMLWLSGLAMSGCQQSGSEAETGQVAEAATATKIVAEPTATELPKATVTPLPSASPTAAPAVATIAYEPTEPATARAPTPTVQSVIANQVNGRHPNGTYFRGRADAPVILIDYSDFF